MTTGAIRSRAIRSAAAMPSRTGIFTSRITRSGRCSSASSTARSPSAACPTTSYPSSASISARSMPDQRLVLRDHDAPGLRGGHRVRLSGAVRPLGPVGWAAVAPVCPTGRGSGLKHRPVWVRIPPGAPCRCRCRHDMVARASGVHPSQRARVSAGVRRTSSNAAQRRSSGDPSLARLPAAWRTTARLSTRGAHASVHRRGADEPALRRLCSAATSGTATCLGCSRRGVSASPATRSTPGSSATWPT